MSQLAQNQPISDAPLSNRIRVLPDAVINKIAAGEVVERPASVVRELVDNAIDAGATDVSVFIEDGGRELIRVVDNGFGMSRDDLLMAFERHATSKLRQFEDLESLITMGFRGEALPSIASVSRVVVKSRPAGGDVATQLSISGGTVLDVRTCSAPPGTDFEVRSLFFNVPARRKFLKQAATEGARIKQWLLNSSLAHPKVRYRLFSEGKEVLNLAPAASLAERAKTLIRGATASFNAQAGGIGISGIIAHPSLAQRDSEALVVLVNGRVVRDKMVLRAVKDGFDSMLKPQETPWGVISLELDPAALDVNVHPQKSEVRFQNGQAVFACVRDVVQRALREFHAPMPSGKEKPIADSRQPMAESREPIAVASFQQSAIRYPLSADRNQMAVAEQQQHYQTQTFDFGPSQTFKFSNLRYIGQALGCFLFCEWEERVYVVDMHAAHERYNFNLIRNGFRQRNLPVQQLLLPLEVAVTELGAAQCLEHRETLERFGFLVQQPRPGVLSVKSAPAVLRPDRVVDVLKELAALDWQLAGREGVEEIFDHVAARIACHGSIRSGRELKREEVYALFESLDSAEFSTACPHGRPVIVSFSAAEIERWFGRDR